MSSGLPLLKDVPVGSMSEATPSRWLSWSDWVGMVASIGCAIHCAAMPFVIAYLPAFGLSFLADEGFHKWMAVACFAIAFMAFVPGLRKHKRLTPLLVGSVGLGMISIAAFGFAGDCCVACEKGAATVTLDPNDQVSGAASPNGEEACTAACCQDDASAEVGSTDVALPSEPAPCCPDCASGNAAGDSGASAGGLTVTSATTEASLASPLLSRVAPWVTPIGGIILVIAHLLNRRYGCLCGCCEKEVAA